MSFHSTIPWNGMENIYVPLTSQNPDLRYKIICITYLLYRHVYTPSFLYFQQPPPQSFDFDITNHMCFEIYLLAYSESALI